jgi:hypothetical protein
MSRGPDAERAEYSKRCEAFRRQEIESFIRWCESQPKPVPKSASPPVIGICPDCEDDDHGNCLSRDRCACGSKRGHKELENPSGDPELW